MFAVIKTGGKQYKVAAEDQITVMTLPGEAGARIVFDEVLALFVGVGLVSVAPTAMYIGWRRRVRADPLFRPPADEIR